eukprot:scaffold222104_cov24-Tisochrysis_lutea.AAC.2
MVGAQLRGMSQAFTMDHTTVAHQQGHLSCECMIQYHPPMNISWMFEMSTVVSSNRGAAGG